MAAAVSVDPISLRLFIRKAPAQWLIGVFMNLTGHSSASYSVRGNWIETTTFRDRHPTYIPGRPDLCYLGQPVTHADIVDGVIKAVEQDEATRSFVVQSLREFNRMGGGNDNTTL